jgi:hypothetical protein
LFSLTRSNEPDIGACDSGLKRILTNHHLIETTAWTAS